ncbi:MAG: comF [Micavibrio sp.]|nr:comF [Micavibrio sp.]
MDQGNRPYSAAPLRGQRRDLGAQGTLAAKVWQDLQFITPPYCALCGYPFAFEAGPDSRCGPCLAEAPPFAAARSVLVYDDVSRELILKFKHGDHLQAVPTLAGMMNRAGGELITGAQVIVPVPLHRWRLLRRRYNQAALLGLSLSRVTGLRCVADGLLRTRATPSQGHMKAKDRSENVRKAFTVNPRQVEAIAGRVVLLVDDVFTTGATVRECTKALLQAGAAEVRVLAVARVVRAESL